MIERRALGRTGPAVSGLGSGGSGIGFERVDVATVRRMVAAALAAGLNVVDTAECCGDSEALIETTVADRRRDYHLFTKCGHFEGSARDDRRPESLERSIARSLESLRTDHLDLLQLHTCSEDDLRRGDVITAAIPGVHTHIVGTTRPGRWRENAALFDGGALSPAEFERIRAHSGAVAAASWVGQR
jgi:aryl-alcohol dehydrogenase-like predicted oxidoreductase